MVMLNTGGCLLPVLTTRTLVYRCRRKAVHPIHGQATGAQGTLAEGCVAPWTAWAVHGVGF